MHKLVDNAKTHFHMYGLSIHCVKLWNQNSHLITNLQGEWHECHITINLPIMCHVQHSYCKGVKGHHSWKLAFIFIVVKHVTRQSSITFHFKYGVSVQFMVHWHCWGNQFVIRPCMVHFKVIDILTPWTTWLAYCWIIIVLEQIVLPFHGRACEEVWTNYVLITLGILGSHCNFKCQNGLRGAQKPWWKLCI